MSAPTLGQNPIEGQSKKRKRTGKEREERKRLAILAVKEAEEAAKSGQAPVAAPTGQPTDPTDPTDAENTGEAEAGAQVKVQKIVDLDKAASRIPQALKTLHPIFKQAKTFETRRLIKKIKFLRTKADGKAELADLEGQLSIIHSIQLHPLAQSHLLVKLRKDARLKRSPLPPTIVDPLTPQEPSVPPTSTSATPALVGKAENRLCSAKNVADGVKNVVSWILGEEGVKLGQLAAKAKAQDAEKEQRAQVSGSKKAVAGVRDDVEALDDEDVTVGGRREMVVESAGEDDSDADDEGNQQDYAVDAAGWESGSIGGDDDSEPESDAEAGSDSDSDAIALPPSKKSKVKPAPAPVAKVTKAAKSSSKAQRDTGDITSSTFLPSLATGFTRGDSDDSDPDFDFDPDGVIGKQGVVRKNRRGQRARQAIWEKKYGKNAKHVVKARQDEDTKKMDKRGRPEGMKGPDAGWGRKPPTTASASAPAPAAVGSGIATASAGAATGGYGGSRPVPPTQAAPAENKALHPSWEAARLRKQKMAAAPVPGANKIVFD